MSMMETADPPSHGFEEAVSSDGAHNNELTKLVSDFQRQYFKDKGVFEKIWRLSFGATTETFQEIAVVGDAETLKKWAPLPSEEYPDFINTFEYTGSDEFDSDGEEIDEAEDEGECLFELTDGDLVVLLPGEYNWANLWEAEFPHNVLVIGVGSEGGVTVYNALYDSFSMIDVKGRACIVGCTLELRGTSFSGFISIAVNACMRLVNCIFKSLGIGDPTSGLIHIQHNAGLIAEDTSFGETTKSCIKCEGRCTVSLFGCNLHDSGYGDIDQRISKVTGSFPKTLKGFHPAISVSCAATIRLSGCTFKQNHGYPLQYSNQDEQDGTVDQDLLDIDPRKYVREMVKRRAKWCQEEVDLDPKSFPYDLDTEQSKEHMFNEELDKRREAIKQVAFKRIKGSIEIDDCCFESNALSPHLCGVSEDGEARIHPWFASDSRIMTLLAEIKMKPLCMTAEAVGDRQAWDETRDPRWDEEDDKKYTPAATLFRSRAENLERHNSEGITEVFAELLLAADPSHFFLRQRNTDEEDCADEIAYGMMDREERDALGKNMARKFNGLLESFPICGTACLMEASYDLELLRICWGRLASEEGSWETLLLAEGGIIALHQKTACALSPYRAEVMVERLQFDFATIERYSTTFTIYYLGLKHASVVDALFKLLNDESATNHGREIAGTTLMRLAFMRADSSLRSRVVKSLSAVIGNERDGLSPGSRAELVLCLARLHAQEYKNLVKDAYEGGRVDEDIVTYAQFLRWCGLPEDNNVAYRGTNSPVPFSVEQTKAPPSKKLPASDKENEENESSSALGVGLPCGQCDKRPPVGEEFLMCSGCNQVPYCSADCQRTSWRAGHKQVCKTLKNKSSKGASGLQRR